ncbi:putative glycoside hydrolase family 10 protein [Neofusicoccum parvum UCRNP2]|uniref:Beta-xylanase n=1 Tax=Botryosphaeria parva (strain UCR-NP2) TaxID=1287680 RepID=R1GC39_BOTPV|nr:putative glycoside hydrolase family 10 protein [Neofusicoccum parvum UCRNP2]
MRFFGTVAIAAAAAAFTAAAPSSEKHGDSGQRPKGLGELAKKAGLKYFGTAIDNVAFNNSKYLSIAYDKHEFSQVTPANGQKWMYTEPERGVFNYTDGDQVIDPSLKAGQLRRCHTLLWHNQLPEWLTSQTWTRDELISILENHIKNVATYYEGKCYAWDVVNEAFEDNGTYRSDIWLDTIGPSYIPLAFQFAAKYTTAKLYYNDYNIETANNKTAAVQRLIRSFRAARPPVPIHGVGLQSHFVAGGAPAYGEQVANMRAFAALGGLEVALTELDVRVELPNDAAKTARQAADYADAVRACVDVDACVGVTVWDFYDPLSWVPATFPGQGDADLLWANFTRKPAYYSVADVLRSAGEDD